MFTSGEPAFIGSRAAAEQQRGPAWSRRGSCRAGAEPGLRPHFSSKRWRPRPRGRLMSVLSRLRYPRGSARAVHPTAFRAPS